MNTFKARMVLRFKLGLIGIEALDSTRGVEGNSVCLTAAIISDNYDILLM